MALLPGDFSTPKAKGSDMRITRIYVSQKDTCYNGKWRSRKPAAGVIIVTLISNERSQELEHSEVSSLFLQSLASLLTRPHLTYLIHLRHLARFEFKSLSKSRSTSSSGHAQPPIVISVFPPSTSDSTEIKPFFTTTLEPVAYLPRSYSFPFNSTWATYFGFSGHMVQPPLPSGPTLEECGTEKWIKAKPELRSKKTRMVWWDMRQPKTETGGERSEGTGSTESDTLLAADQASKRQQVVSDNWWPGLGKWRIGLWLEDAVLELGEGETFTL